MLKVPNFTKKELDYIRKYGNLTPREDEVLKLRNDEYPPTIKQFGKRGNVFLSTARRCGDVRLLQSVRQ